MVWDGDLKQSSVPFDFYQVVWSFYLKICVHFLFYKLSFLIKYQLSGTWGQREVIYWQKYMDNVTRYRVTSIVCTLFFHWMFYCICDKSKELFSRSRMFYICSVARAACLSWGCLPFYIFVSCLPSGWPLSTLSHFETGGNTKAVSLLSLTSRSNF